MMEEDDCNRIQHLEPSMSCHRSANKRFPLSTSRRIASSPGPRMLFGDAPLTVYLIRHGESLAQTFSKNKRESDVLLRDCGLSEKGEQQSIVLPGILGLDRYRHIECVVSSPLTRAVKTSVLGFPSKPIIINYDLMEIGRDKNRSPENQARPIKTVMADTGGENRIDEAYFAPKNKPFPQSHQNSPNSIRKSKLPKAWEAIWQCCSRRNYKRVAVVCHFNVMRMSMDNGFIKPRNAIPVECRLYRDGRLEFVEVLSDQVQDMTESLAALKRRNNWCMRNLPHGQELHETVTDADNNDADESEASSLSDSLNLERV